MFDLRLSGVLGLSMALALAGCGQPSTPQAKLVVESVPKAEVFVDGVRQGTSGGEIRLSTGVHKLSLRLDQFETINTTVTLAAGATETIHASLRAQDPGHPLVIACLGEAEGIEVAPFSAPNVMRGASTKRAIATLLWPSRDVRKAGLTTYAIEANETYGSDASLEFRQGRKILYRQAFKPDSLTTVRRLPAAVIENARVGRKITWGLFFEDRRRPIKSEFKVVNRPKAERQLERLRHSRHMARQPQLTRKIMAATVLENNRLFTEALQANIQISRDYPLSTQPYRGIVTTLRRLDAEDSELFAFVSPNVAGKGGHVAVRTVPAGLGGIERPSIAAWAEAKDIPVQQPSPSRATPVTPGGQGVTPPTGESNSSEGTPPIEGEQPDPTAQPNNTPLMVERLRHELAEAAEESLVAVEAYEHAEAEANNAARAAEEAEAQAAAADATAAEARDAVEQATEPTPAQLEQMYRSGMAAEQAHEAANAAREAAEQAAENARTHEAAAAELAQSIMDLQRALELVTGSEPRTTDDPRTATDPVPPVVEPTPTALPTEQTLRDALQQATLEAEQRQADWTTAKEAVELAVQELEANPSETTTQNLENATERLQGAETEVAQALRALEAARVALDRVGLPSDPQTEAPESK